MSRAERHHSTNLVQTVFWGILFLLAGQRIQASRVNNDFLYQLERLKDASEKIRQDPQVPQDVKIRHDDVARLVNGFLEALEKGSQLDKSTPEEQRHFKESLERSRREVNAQARTLRRVYGGLKEITPQEDLDLVPSSRVAPILVQMFGVLTKEALETFVDALLSSGSSQEDKDGLVGKLKGYRWALFQP